MLQVYKLIIQETEVRYCSYVFIEIFGKIIDNIRLTMRFDKTDTVFLSFIALRACTHINQKQQIYVK